jgi:hypothetical protein
VKWGRILVAGIGTWAAALLVITLVVTGYAFKLSFEVRGGARPGSDWAVC